MLTLPEWDSVTTPEEPKPEAQKAKSGGGISGVGAYLEVGG